MLIYRKILHQQIITRTNLHLHHNITTLCLPNQLFLITNLPPFTYPLTNKLFSFTPGFTPVYSTNSNTISILSPKTPFPTKTETTSQSDFSQKSHLFFKNFIKHVMCSINHTGLITYNGSYTHRNHSQVKLCLLTHKHHNPKQTCFILSFFRLRIKQK